MTNLNEKIEKYFVKMGSVFYQNPLITLSVVSLLLSFPLFHLPNVSFNGTSKALLRKDDGTLKAYDTFELYFKTNKGAVTLRNLSSEERFN